VSLRVRELTPKGAGAVAVLELRGVGAWLALRTLARGTSIPIGIPALTRLRSGDEELDEALVCAYSRTHVELHLHGSPPLVRRLVQLLSRAPAAADGPAESPVEQRSVRHLAQDHLADAPCEAAARILLDQAEGALTRDLRALVSMGEADRERELAALLERGRIARFALRPAVILLAGRTNAGKSTLFNALLGERRAIVDDAPGTTRDLLRERAQLGAWPVVLVDTAGERELDSARLDPGAQAWIEGIGQGLARAAREAADLVLWLEPCDPQGAVASIRPVEGRTATIPVGTFADLVPLAARPAFAVDARHEPSAARKRISFEFRERLRLPEDPWIPGAGVPFTPGLLDAVAGLRACRAADLVQAVETLLAGS
jgi:tRNA modification GTPase